MLPRGGNASARRARPQSAPHFRARARSRSRSRSRLRSRGPHSADPLSGEGPAASSMTRTRARRRPLIPSAAAGSLGPWLPRYRRGAVCARSDPASRAPRKFKYSRAMCLGGLILHRRRPLTRRRGVEQRSGTPFLNTTIARACGPRVRCLQLKRSRGRLRPAARGLKRPPATLKRTCENGTQRGTGRCGRKSGT